MRIQSLCLLTVAISCAACNDAPAPPTLDVLAESDHLRICFRRIDLGTLGGPTSDVVAINRRGEIVGNSDTAGGESHAYLWRHGVMIDLGTLGGGLSRPVALDNRGRVVGFSRTEPGTLHAFVWDRGVMTDLTPDDYKAVANGINDRGDIVGVDMSNPISKPIAVLWRNGVMIDLGVGIDSGATAVNERGDIIGVANFGESFLWRAGTITRFSAGTLDAIDDRGRVVGLNEVDHAFVWQDGVSRDLGTLGGADSAAIASNGREIAGWADTTGNQMHAVVWRHGRIHDLHVPGDNNIASGINARGDIVGEGHGLTRAFFWSHGDTIDLGETVGDVFLDDAAQVAGTVSVGPSTYHAMLWRPHLCFDERAPSVEEAPSFSADD